jgi:transcriptional regulator with XRE-family HTH domain
VGQVSVIVGGVTTTRRPELADFLRSRRARVSPEEVGLPPGLRRRTPGLRREEVAQLAGVGITWYTWLEQGRPINASPQVLDAVARTLRLEGAERDHLYRLAGVAPPARTASAQDAELPPSVQQILDAVAPLPASVTNPRYDLLAWNGPYARLFPAMVGAPPGRRNTIWQIFTMPECCNGFRNRAEEYGPLVAALRGSFGKHLGDPGWQEFVDQLCAASPLFAGMWASHDVALPRQWNKIFRHDAFGDLHMVSTAMSLNPEARMLVYTPVDEDNRARLEKILAMGEVPPIAPHAHPPAHPPARPR